MLRLLLNFVVVLSLGVTVAEAQHYPDHPVKVVVGYAAGGGPDIQARTVSAQLSLDLGQQFFVENRTGANGTIGTRAVVQAKPDGYTLLYTSNGIAPTPYIYKNLGYDIFTDHANRKRRRSRWLVHVGGRQVTLQNPAGVYCSREKGPRGLRLSRCRERLAPGSRDLQQKGRHQHAARTLQGGLGSHDRHAERQC
jgi:tripartite-type tricarboxylate transporter receptor subunit TctC